jgi:hypothetical protein
MAWAKAEYDTSMTPTGAARSSIWPTGDVLFVIFAANLAARQIVTTLSIVEHRGDCLDHSPNPSMIVGPPYCCESPQACVQTEFSGFSGAFGGFSDLNRKIAQFLVEIHIYVVLFWSLTTLYSTIIHALGEARKHLDKAKLIVC